MRTLRAGGAIARCAAAPAFAPSRLRLRRARFWLWLRFWSRTPTWAMGSARRGRKLPFGRRNRRDVAENSHLGDEIGTPIWATKSARRGRKLPFGRWARRGVAEKARLGDEIGEIWSNPLAWATVFCDFSESWPIPPTLAILGRSPTWAFGVSRPEAAGALSRPFVAISRFPWS